MLTKLRMNAAFIVVSGLVITASITASFTNMFGKQYKKNQNYSCCNGDQLVIHHYYTIKFFWADVATGYTLEPTGKVLPGGCNIKCK